MAPARAKRPDAAVMFLLLRVNTGQHRLNGLLILVPFAVLFLLIRFFGLQMGFPFRILFVLIVLAHDRRRIVHFNVTEHPTARWTGEQIIQAFPDDSVPRYLLRDRDSIYGKEFRERIGAIGIEEVITTHGSPWQNPFCERLIGSVRRDCLNHVIILGESHLRKILARYFRYYHKYRTHLSLAKDASEPRAIQEAELGKVIEIPEVGGLHHHYERRAA